jgi:hypothetical protein
MNDLTEKVVKEIHIVHDLQCDSKDVRHCLKHHTLILGLKNLDLVLENQIRAHIVEEMTQLMELMVQTKEPEEGTAAMWIRYAFDKAIGFTRGKHDLDKN